MHLLMGKYYVCSTDTTAGMMLKINAACLHSIGISDHCIYGIQKVTMGRRKRRSLRRHAILE